MREKNVTQRDLAFQSTPSVGRATIVKRETARAEEISIHALRGEGDTGYRARERGGKDFNPRPPWGGRRYRQRIAVLLSVISIHALRGEGDLRDGLHGIRS